MIALRVKTEFNDNFFLVGEKKKKKKKIGCMFYFKKYREANGDSPDIKKMFRAILRLKNAVICVSCTNTDFISSPWYYCSYVKGDYFVSIEFGQMRFLFFACAFY